VATAQKQVSLTYRGDAVDDGLMRVEDLAPAMMGASRAFRRAQRIATGGNGPMPEVHVRALREGSFAIDLVLVEGSHIKDVVDLLTGDNSSAVVNLGFYVTVAFGGFKLIKAKFNREVRSREVEGRNVTVTFDDGTSVEIPLASERLAQDPEFTAAAREVVSPLEDEGVAEAELSTDDDSLTVTRDERPAFTPIQAVDGVHETQMDMRLSLVTIAFTEGNKWRVSDGANAFWVDIEDEAFNERIAAGEAFAKGDLIRASVRFRQWKGADGKLKMERAIVSVLEHRRDQNDDPLPFS